MTYPTTPGYQSHSETSREAADSLDATHLRNTCYNIIHDAGFVGATADDIAATLGKQNSTVAARLRELELTSTIIKTAIKRKTRANRNAYVYVSRDHHRPGMGQPKVKPDLSRVHQAAKKFVVHINGRDHNDENFNAITDTPEYWELHAALREQL